MMTSSPSWSVCGDGDGGGLGLGLLPGLLLLLGLSVPGGTTGLPLVLLSLMTTIAMERPMAPATRAMTMAAHNANLNFPQQPREPSFSGMSGNIRRQPLLSWIFTEENSSSRIVVVVTNCGAPFVPGSLGGA